METQSAALSVSAPSGPPPVLERTVQWLLPPAVRETVGGDLCEMYRSPLQYARQAAATLPFVIASQARHNANWPVLGLQGLILHACFQGLFALKGHAGYALPATAACLVALLLREAYQTQQRLHCRRAILETVFLSAAVMPLLPQYLLMAPVEIHQSRFWWPDFALLGGLMLMLPLLCGLRAGLILENDRRHPASPNHLTAKNLSCDYRQFRQGTLLRNRLEGGAMMTAVILYALLGRKFGMGNGEVSLVIGVYTAASAYLLLEASAQPMAAGSDLLSLSAHYRHELAQRHQLRRFLCWLWYAPFFLMAYTHLIAPGAAAGQPSDVIWGILAALLLGFFISAHNRDGAGPVQEKIGLLGQMHQT